MPLLTRRRQIAARVKANAEGSAFEAATLAAANADLLVYEPRIVYEVNQFERNPVRDSIGSLASIAGQRLGRLTFRMEMKGAGSAGSIPPWGRLLRACGFGQTQNTGVEAIGAAVNHPGNTGVSPAPVIAIANPGAFSVSGIIVLQLIAKTITNPEDATFAATFYPGDGTEASYGEVTVTDTSFTNEAFGGDMSDFDLTVNDPDGSGVGDPVAAWNIGDRWFFTYTSADQAEVSYKPISNGIAILDIGFYQDGRLHRLSNARGTVRMMARIGEPGFFEFEFMGVPDTAATDVVDAALLSGIAFPDVVPPAFMGVTATLHSATPECFTNLEIDVGNTLAARLCADKETGHVSARITDRNVTGSIDPEAALVATFDPFSKLFAGTTGNLIAQWGATAGNIVKVQANRVQITGVDDQDRDGIAVDQLDLRFNEPEFDGGGAYHELEIIAK
jgi:hypothetical protein